MKSFFKKAAKLVLSVITAAAVSMSATGISYADIIWEPENSFYQNHRGECREEDRTFQANSIDEDGLKVYESPESTKVIEVIPNGQYVWICSIYTDKAGNDWGCVGSSEGWAPMDYLVNVYDETAFRQDHYEEITEESGSLDISGYTEDDRLFIYPYPGSEDNYDLTLYEEGPGYYGTYTDPAGHKWGYVSYYYIQEGWICLDDPTAAYADLYPNGQEFSGQTVEPELPNIIVEPIKKVNIPLIVGICVGVIVIVTAVILIFIFSRKNIKETKE